MSAAGVGVPLRMNRDASATYKQLEDGSWGCWTDLQGLAPGKSITVTTNSGATKLERLKKQIWTNGSLSLWSLRGPKDENTLPLF